MNRPGFSQQPADGRAGSPLPAVVASPTSGAHGVARPTRVRRIFCKLLPARRSTALLLAVAVFLAFAAISCRTTSRVSVMLPNVPGATYIGSKECEQCHEEIYRDFKTADHALLTLGGLNALNAGCESCHGPASLHSESGGEVKPPYSFSSARPGANSYGANLATPAHRTGGPTVAWWRTRTP